MAFEIIWDTDARKFLRKLDSKIASRIVRKVDFIRDHPQDYLEPVKQTNSYKLRVGDYRVIIDIDWENEISFVLLVDHRKRIYKRLFKVI